MLRILLHLALLPFVARYQRATDYRRSPAMLALLWYLAGVPLMLAESVATADASWSGPFFQGAACAAFFLPAAWGFFFVRARRKNPMLPFLALGGLLALGAMVTASAFARIEVLGNLAA